jgi:hypothetical protein
MTGSLTVEGLNEVLDSLAQSAGSIESQAKILQRVYNETTPEEQRWIVRIILKGDYSLDPSCAVAHIYRYEHFCQGNNRVLCFSSRRPRFVQHLFGPKKGGLDSLEPFSQARGKGISALASLIPVLFLMYRRKKPYSSFMLSHQCFANVRLNGSRTQSKRWETNLSS